MDSDIFFIVPLMSEADQDRAMAAYDKEVAEEKAEEKAKFRASATSHVPAPTYDAPGTAAVLSPKWLAAKERLEAAMKPKKPLITEASAASHAVLEPAAPPAPRSDARAIRIEPEIKATPLAVESTLEDVIAAPTPPTDVAWFPVVNLMTVTDFEDPLKAMADLCKQLLTHKDYLRVRDNYCRLSISLNLIGKLAPGWRPQLKAGAAFGMAIHKVIHRDQVVIDLHWCHATKMPLMPQDAEHVALFSDSAGFDFELAWELAGKKWKGTYRAAEALCLTTLQQCQMLTLVGPELKAGLDELKSEWRKSGGKTASRMATVRREIAQWAERDKRIQQRRDDYEKLWLARELLGPDASKQQIADLNALMVGGEAKNRRTVQGMLEALDRNITVA